MRLIKDLFNLIFKPFILGDLGLEEKDLYPPYELQPRNTK